MAACIKTVLDQDVYTALCGFGAGLPFTDEAAFELTYDLAESILDTIPGFSKVYTMEGDMKLEMFHLENAVVEFRNMMKCVERYEL